MSQFNAPVRRTGGHVDVYTGLLLAAFIVLAAGVAMMAKRNMDHSAFGTQQGGLITLVN